MSETAPDYIADIQQAANTLRPIVEKVTTRLMAEQPEIELDQVTNIVISNIWWELERRMREDQDRRLHEQGLAFAEVVTVMVHDVWANAGAKTTS